jgi:hypothetical protein
MNARSRGPSRYSVFSPIGAGAVAAQRTVARRLGSVPVAGEARVAKQSSTGINAIASYDLAPALVLRVSSFVA